MKVIKKINNNVAVCVDNNNNELIAFGKGIGFPAMPYIIENLEIIDVTFYRVDAQVYTLLKEIPEEVFEISTKVVLKAQKELKTGLNPNVVFSLADHINFALVRQHQYKDLKMAFSYDVEQLYPEETMLGNYALKLIQEKMYISLPKYEVTSIALHFVNAEKNFYENSEELNTEDVIYKIVEMIEDDFNLAINKNEFNYNRFAMHIRYYIKRINEGKQFIDNCKEMISVMAEDFPSIYTCAKKVASYIDECFESVSTEDEIFYLMIHINRMISQEK